MGVGVGAILRTYFFRREINKFLAPEFKEKDAHPVIVQFACLGAAVFVAAFIASVFLDLATKSQLQRIRKKYFKVI